MRNLNIRPLLAVVLGLVTTAAWVALIWTALAVSTVVLDTLSMIVELAAMSPD